MSRNVKLAVFFEPQEFIDIQTYAKENHIDTKTDSRMIRGFVLRLIATEDNTKITMYAMQQQINRLKEEKIVLENIIDRMKGIKREKAKVDEIKKINIEAKRQRNAKKKK